MKNARDIMFLDHIVSKKLKENKEIYNLTKKKKKKKRFTNLNIVLGWKFGGQNI